MLPRVCDATMPPRQVAVRAYCKGSSWLRRSVWLGLLVNMPTRLTRSDISHDEKWDEAFSNHRTSHHEVGPPQDIYDASACSTSPTDCPPRTPTEEEAAPVHRVREEAGGMTVRKKARLACEAAGTAERTAATPLSIAAVMRRAMDRQRT